MLSRKIWYLIALVRYFSTIKKGAYAPFFNFLLALNKADLKPINYDKRAHRAQ
jgi:hypothetical protein